MKRTFLEEVNHRLGTQFKSLDDAYLDNAFMDEYMVESECITDGLVIQTVGFKHKEDVFTDFTDDSYDDLRSTIKNLEPFTDGLTVRILDDHPDDLEGQYRTRHDVTTNTYGNYSIVDGINVNAYSTGSFVHELGHHIDGTHILDTFNRFSDEEAFQPVIEAYAKLYHNTIKKLKVGHPDADYEGAEQYYLNPREIFARTFQVWYNRHFEPNVWSINTSSGLGDKIAEQCDNTVIESYFNVVLSKCEGLSHQQFQEQINELQNTTELGV